MRPVLSTTRPLPITTKLSDSTQKTCSPTFTVAAPMNARVTTTRLLPTTTKPSGSIQKARKLTRSVAPPTTTRAITTRPLPTTTKPSGSTQNTRSPTIASHGFLGHVRKSVSATASYHLQVYLWNLRQRFDCVNRGKPRKHGHDSVDEFCTCNDRLFR